MKKVKFLMLCVLFALIGTTSLQGQQTEEEKTTTSSEEEEGPIIFKFEPNFLTSVEIRREEIKKTRAIIDTMNISDRKRRRLLRDLYKNGTSERLSKALVAETKFDGDDEIEN